VELTLTFVESDRRGVEKIVKKEVLRDESAKPLTKGRASKLIARFHPEFAVAGSVMLIDSVDHPQFSFNVVKPIRLGSNKWLHVYVSD
jgi:hypothetical protein